MGYVEGGLKLLETIGHNVEMATVSGMTNLQDPLLGLLCTLAIISVCTEFEMFFNYSWNWGNIITKIIHIGFLAFLIKSWPNMIDMVKTTGEKLGMAASGSDVMQTPTELISKVCDKLFDSFGLLFKNFPGITSGTIFIHVLAVVALGFALFAIFRVAYVLFMANAEFIILCSLSIVLLPFGITKWTSDICNKTWGILLTCAVKLMVAIFIVCLIGNDLQTAFHVEGKVTSENVSSFIISACSLVFLSYLSAQAVEFAGAMTTGTSFNTNNFLHASAGSAAITAGSIAASGGGAAIGKVASSQFGQAVGRAGATMARDGYAAGKSMARDGYAAGKSMAKDGYAAGKSMTKDSYAAGRTMARDGYAAGRTMAKDGYSAMKTAASDWWNKYY